MRRTPFIALAAGMLLGAAACTPTEADAVPGSVTRQENVVSGTGTVRWFGFEGGFFAIRGDDDVTYDPVNLAPEFKRDGMRVRFRANLRSGVSIHMAGPIVEIVEIAPE